MSVSGENSIDVVIGNITIHKTAGVLEIIANKIAKSNYVVLYYSVIYKHDIVFLLNLNYDKSIFR